MKEKSSFQVIWEVVYALLMFLLVRSIVTWLLGGFLLRRELWNENSVAILSALAYAAGVLPVFSRARERIAVRTGEWNKNHPEKRKIWHYGILAVVVCGVVLGLNFLLAGFAGQSADYQQVAQTQHGAALPVAILCYGLVTPAAEEVIFRGMIYNSFRRMLHPWVAAFLSALVFGLYHGNAVQGIYGFLMSLLIIGGYEYFGKFQVAVGIHIAANVIACVLPYMG